MTDLDPSRSVVVVGGGLAGVLVVIQLLQRATYPLTVTILEPRDRLGAGVAYSGAEPCHVTNVPAANMSVDPDDPGAFARWLDTHGDRPTGDERDSYPRRWLFGDFARSLFASASAARPDISVIHVRQNALDVERTAAGFVVQTDAGFHAADAVVLATGNPVPYLPEALKPLAGLPGCIVDPWTPGVLADVPRDARVLIVGTGLTMGDTVAVLRASGHRGAIVAVSRRGQLSRRGLADPIDPFGDFELPPPTALALLRLFRGEVRRAVAAGTSWYAVLAAARRAAWPIWAALPPAERRRFVRHLRLPYEVHRHVMAGPVYDLVAGGQRDGGLQVRAARLRRARVTDAGFEIDLQPRGGGAQAVRSETFGALVNCTGPAYAALAATDPFWASLTRRGLVRADPAGLGPEADDQGRAVGADGAAQPDLLLAGTLARSAFGELTGVREISAEARLAIDGLLARWGEVACDAKMRAAGPDRILAAAHSP